MAYITVQLCVLHYWSPYLMLAHSAHHTVSWCTGASTAPLQHCVSVSQCASQTHQYKLSLQTLRNIVILINSSFQLYFGAQSVKIQPTEEIFCLCYKVIAVIGESLKFLCIFSGLFH